MPVDYSKWDALELSDDSDIEVHPNVDKRSFIRAKQNQIHMERQQRRHQIETLKYERVVNDGLAKRIDSLLAALREHSEEARAEGNPNAAGEVAFRAVMQSAGQVKPEEDRPPAPPAGVHSATGEAQPESYTKMMAALLDQVNKALADRQLEGAARYDAMVAEIQGHAKKVADLQAQLIAKLGELEQAEHSKITSDDIHTGFDSSFVAKAKAGESSSSQVELLNPGYSQGAHQPTNKNDSGGKDDGDVTTSALARAFAAIPLGNHAASLAFIREHPELVAEKEEEGLLLLAFDAEFAGQPDAARRAVHQATLLEFCRALGRDGVLVFFKRMMTPGHQAQDVFAKDVQDKYNRIRTRVREINAQKAAGSNPESGDGIEQIQLHAVEPGTVINIRIPPAEAADPETQQARQVFEGFAPEMKAALASGSLDKVNEVLGRMPVDQAEALVGQFGEAGILSLEEEIIDATTEEGRAHLKELGREGVEGVEEEKKEKKEEKGKKEEKEEYPDPE